MNAAPSHERALEQMGRAAAAAESEHPEFHEGALDLTNKILAAHGRLAIEMSNTLVRAELEQRERRFSGESLPGFQR